MNADLSSPHLDTLWPEIKHEAVGPKFYSSDSSFRPPGLLNPPHFGFL